MSGVPFLLVIDVEASGRNVVRNFMPSFGACIVDVAQHKVVDEFLAYMEQPPGTEWEQRCVDEFWNNAAMGRDGKTQMQLLDEARAAHGVEPCARAMRRFVRWARDATQRCGKEQMLVVCDTAAFDTTWMNTYLSRYSGCNHNEDDDNDNDNRCDSLLYLTGEYQPVRDISSFYHGVAGQLRAWNGDEHAMKRLHQGHNEVQWPSWATAVNADHNPLNDAKHIGLRAAYVLHLLNHPAVTTQS